MARHIAHVLLPAGGHKHRHVTCGHREACLLEVVRRRAVEKDSKVWPGLDGLHKAVHQRVRQRDGAEARLGLGRQAERVGWHVGGDVQLHLAVDRHLGDALARNAQGVRVVDQRLRHGPLVVRRRALVRAHNRARGVAVALQVIGRRRVRRAKRRGHDHRVIRHVRAQALEGLARKEFTDLVEVLVVDDQLLVRAEDVGTSRHAKGSIAARLAAVPAGHGIGNRDVQVLRRVDLREVLKAEVGGSLLGVAHARRKLEPDRAEDNLAIEVAAFALHAGSAPVRRRGDAAKARCAPLPSSREGIVCAVVAHGAERELHLSVSRVLHHPVLGDGNRVDVRLALRRLQRVRVLAARLPGLAVRVLVTLHARGHDVVAPAPVPLVLRTVAGGMVRVGKPGVLA